MTTRPCARGSSRCCAGTAWRSSAPRATWPPGSTSWSTASPTWRSSTSACPTAAASSSRASCSPSAPTLGVMLYTGDADAELLYSGLDSGARGYALKAGSMRGARRRDPDDRGRRLVRRSAPGPHPALPARDRPGPPALAARARDHAPHGRGRDGRGDRHRARRVGGDRAHPRAQRHPQAAGAQPRARHRARARARRDRARRAAAGAAEHARATSCGRSCTTCARR